MLAGFVAQDDRKPVFVDHVAGRIYNSGQGGEFNVVSDLLVMIPKVLTTVERMKLRLLGHAGCLAYVVIHKVLVTAIENVTIFRAHVYEGWCVFRQPL